MHSDTTAKFAPFYVKRDRREAKKIHFKEMADPGIRFSSSMTQSTSGVESIATCLLLLYLR